MKKNTSRFPKVGGLLLIAGLIIFVASFSRLYQGHSLTLQFQSQGTVQRQTDSVGRFYVWDNYVTHFNGQKVRLSSKTPKNLQISIQDTNGASLEFVPDDSQSWSIGNHAKKSIGYVEVKEPQSLNIISSGSDQRILSFGPANLKAELWQKLGGFALAILIGGLGFVWCLLSLFLGGRK